MLARAWKLLTPRERRRCVLLQMFALLMALTTVAGIAAVMPFFAVLGDPALVETNPALRWLHSAVAPANLQAFTLILGCGFILLLLLSSALSLAGTVAMGRFAYGVGDRLRTLLFRQYLGRDYLFHARSAGGVLTSRVLYQSDRVTGLLQSGFVFVSNLLTILLIVVSIMLIDPRVAVAGLLLFGTVYALVYVRVRRRLLANGVAQTQAGAERVAVVEQALAGIKDVLVSQGQDYFTRRFSAACDTISRAAADTQVVGLAPRYLLECLAGMALIAAALILSGRSPSTAWLGPLTFIAVAGYRLLPAIQQCYFSFVTVRANQSAFDEVTADLQDVSVPPPAAAPLSGLPRVALEVSGLRFSYEAGGRPVIDDVSLRIAAGSSVAFVGPNGSGKTTTADLLVGLLTADAGQIVIDGQPLGAANRAAWQACIAYVPQQIFILDATVRENIALGIDAAAIDEARLIEAARRAGAHEFVEKLPRGYQERLGTRGARLSGGQRQQIGLARALYRSPSFLVLDEATSSLDESAARAVVEMLRRLRGECTVVVITHHPAIVAACDRSCEFREGRLVTESTSAGGASRLRDAS